MAVAPEKNLYEVHIAGLPLKLRSAHDEKTVTELITLVDQKIKEAMSLNQTVSFQNALLLAALHIAEDLILIKRAALTEIENLEGRTRHILSEIESSPINRIRLDN